MSFTQAPSQKLGFSGIDVYANCADLISTPARDKTGKWLGDNFPDEGSRIR